MILIFGGTTEGKAAVETLDGAGQPYYYSTRGTAQQVECKHGVRISGVMEQQQMVEFCRGHEVRLLVDAAHPFAEQLHRNIAGAAEILNIPVIRYERVYPLRDPGFIWCDTYDDAVGWMEKQGVRNLLALSGVQTIPKLQAYWMKYPCWFRVLNRAESTESALRYGFPKERLLYFDEKADEETLFARLLPDAILTKESGESGYFEEKVGAACKLNIPVIVIKRPVLSDTFYVVSGQHGLRHRVERLLPGFFPLNSGYTSGSCVTAAAKAALTTLLTGGVRQVVEITLPGGEVVELPVFATERKGGTVICSVLKDAGDDPDVTHGKEIRVSVSLADQPGIQFRRGEGVGVVTLPGLGLEVGEPAINPVPRKMMTFEIEKLLSKAGIDRGVVVEVSVPGGEELALKTFNPKLGIVGGISIIGTSGIVHPFSSEAFVEAIRKEMQVAKALGCKHIVINSGAKSEKVLRKRFPDLLPQAFIHYGNYIGETLKIAEEEGIERVTMGIMIGKAVKLAEGNVDTHSRNVVMNPDFIAGLAREAGCTEDVCRSIFRMVLARELWILLPEEHPFFHLLLQRCEVVLQTLLKNCHLEIILIPESSAG